MLIAVKGHADVKKACEGHGLLVLSVQTDEQGHTLASAVAPDALHLSQDLGQPQAPYKCHSNGRQGRV